MKVRRFAVLVFSACFCLLFLGNWGFFAHKRINRLAVFTLPPEMIGFYKSHIEYITEQAVRADKRRYVVDAEAPRHFIDIDYYGEYPFSELPRDWDTAVVKYTEDTIMEYGIVPWRVLKVQRRLTQAFRKRDKDDILRLSADLGHYISDAHVPLHTTLNYNGQLTGQEGIHAFWESRLPELFADNYDYFVGKAAYIKHPHTRIWEVVLKSHTLVDSVLLIEKRLSEQFPEDRKFTYEERGSRIARQYSREYSTVYHKAMDGMVEARMRQSVKMIGSFWFTAWVDAGQPDLTDIEAPLTEELRQKFEEEEEAWKKGKIMGREHEE